MRTAVRHSLVTLPVALINAVTILDTLKDSFQYIHHIRFVTCPLWSQKVEVLYVFSEGFDILVNCIWSHASNLDQAVVLDEYCVAGQVAVDDRGVAAGRSCSQ